MDDFPKSASTTSIRPASKLVAIGLLSIVVLSIVHQVLLTRAAPDVPYMDSLRLLAQLQDWRIGLLSTLEFWGQGSAHRGFVNQAFLLANVDFFGLDIMLANRLTAVVILAVSLVLVLAWGRDVRTQDVAPSRMAKIVLALTTVAVAGLCFSWAGVELLTLDLGLPLWTKNLCFLLFFVGHAAILSGHLSSIRALQVVLAAAAPFLVLLVGMGWNYAFVGAVLALQLLAFLPRWRQEGRWLGLLPTIAVLVSFAIYIGSGQMIHAEADSARISFSTETMVLPFYALGSAFGGHEALLHGGRSRELLLGLGALLVLSGGGASLSWLRRAAPGSRLPLYLILYGGLTAVSVSIARGGDGPGAVVASRYYMDFVFLLIGVLWLAAREVATLAPSARRLPGSAVLVLLCLVASGHALTYFREWQAGPFRELIFKAMGEAMVRGVPDEASARLLQSPLDHARQGVNVMRDHRLSLFAGLPADYCRLDDVRYGAGWNGEEAQGRWTRDASELFLPKCECDFAAEVYLPGVMSAREVRVIGSDGLERRARVEPGRSSRLVLGPSVDGGRVRLLVSPTTIPSRESPGSLDARVLGIMVSDISLSCDGSPK
ncbi:hypothetical protein ABE488_17430 [Luteimonas sp. TWI662]|uniref:hypothetical protein n=1 Tax=Luteimonas sp. TWI662 TaxID=3136789 RepID=UPI00320A5549